MYKIYDHLFVLLAVIQSSFPQRRIKDGQQVTSDKGYMVYLLNAPSAPVQYHGWLCGGAIITKDYVITSAACVEDVKHLYVVPGYRKYVSSDRLDKDECVKQKKKKVVLTCVPKGYQFEYNRTEVWSKMDIALVKVESSFDFNDKSYEAVCSYTPKPIEFNAEKEFPKVGDDVFVLGWGHSKQFRKDEDLTNLNQEVLHYAATKILDDKTCIRHFQGNKELASFIESSMLCTLEPGNLNDKGELILRSPPIAKGCISHKAKLMGEIGKMCDGDIKMHGEGTGIENTYNVERAGKRVGFNYLRRQVDPDVEIKVADTPGQVVNDTTTNPEIDITHAPGVTVESSPPEDEIQTTTQQGQSDVNNELNKHVNEAETTTSPKEKAESSTPEVELESMTPQSEVESITPEAETEYTTSNGDTPGICQNDHGGPLVAWRGGKEVVVGIATLFKLNKKHQCIGPYLFTKTWCNSAFLHCIINLPDKKSKTRRNCNDPAEVGFEIIRRHISWVGHKDGPADNERIHLRQQVPMSVFRT